MITKRLAMLLFILCGGMGAVAFVPRVPQSQPAGIDLALPASIGEWQGKDSAVSDNEREQLGAETEFARKLYKDNRGNQIFVSVVLAGRDMNTSIHRPERCLPSQGWTIVSTGVQPVPLGGPDGSVLKVTRLRNVRGILLPNGKPYSLCCLDYYWFVGAAETTPSHATRMLIDIRDRLLRGTNQRWAYITVMAPVTSGLGTNGLSEKETDDLIGAFIKQLLPIVQKPGVTCG